MHNYVSIINKKGKYSILADLVLDNTERLGELKAFAEYKRWNKDSELLPSGF